MSSKQMRHQILNVRTVNRRCVLLEHVRFFIFMSPPLVDSVIFLLCAFYQYIHYTRLRVMLPTGTSISIAIYRNHHITSYAHSIHSFRFVIMSNSERRGSEHSDESDTVLDVTFISVRGLLHSMERRIDRCQRVVNERDTQHKAEASHVEYSI
jgi:hypothetical protein